MTGLQLQLLQIRDSAGRFADRVALAANRDAVAAGKVVFASDRDAAEDTVVVATVPVFKDAKDDIAVAATNLQQNGRPLHNAETFLPAFPFL